MNLSSYIWIIILAAGFSVRMGERNKLLLPVSTEESLLRHIVRKAVSVNCGGIIVVLNPSYYNMKNEICDLPVNIVWNEKAYLGMSTSIKKGVESLPDKASGAVIMLADQPNINPQVIKRLIKFYNRNNVSIAQVTYQGQPAHPVLFDKVWFSKLKKLKGDQGGKTIIEKHIDKRRLLHMSQPPPEDIDTLEDYQKIILRRGLIYEI